MQARIPPRARSSVLHRPARAHVHKKGIGVPPCDAAEGCCLWAAGGGGGGLAPYTGARAEAEAREGGREGAKGRRGSGPAPPLGSFPGGLSGCTPPAMAMSCGVQCPPTYTGSCEQAARIQFRRIVETANHAKVHSGEEISQERHRTSHSMKATRGVYTLAAAWPRATARSMRSCSSF